MIRKIDCEDCRGIGTTLCPRCQGDEVDINGHKCAYCDGAGLTICHRCSGRGVIEVEVDDEYASMGY